MKGKNNIKLQFWLALTMFIVSIIMTVQYYPLIESKTATTINTVAFYVWIASIIAWGVKAVHDYKILSKTDGN